MKLNNDALILVELAVNRGFSALVEPTSDPYPGESGMVVDAQVSIHLKDAMSRADIDDLIEEIEQHNTATIYRESEKRIDCV